MTQQIEERLRETLSSVAQGVVSEGRWDQVAADAQPPSSDRPEDHQRGSLVAIAAALVIAAGFGALFVVGGSDEQSTVTSGVDFVLPGEIVLDDDPLTVIPAPAPVPAFDTSEMGTEVIFEAIDQMDEEIAELVDRAVSSGNRAGSPDLTKVTLAGRVGGHPWMIVVTDGPNTDGIGGGSPEENVRKREVVSPVGGSGSGDLVPYDSLEMIEPPETDDPSRTPGASYTTPTGWLNWNDLPADAGVVTFSDSDQELWMRPRAGMVVFATQFDNGERFELKAYDAAGNIIRTYSETARYDGDLEQIGLRVGDQLEVVRGTDQNGEPVRIGPEGRPTALVFGADWCAPCQSGLGEIRRLVEALDESVAIYSVPHNTDQPWPQDSEWPYLQLSLEINSPLRAVGLLPTIVVLDGQNNVVLVERGLDDSTMVAFEDLRRQLNQLPDSQQPDPQRCAELLDRKEVLDASEEQAETELDQAQAKLSEARLQSLPDIDLQAAEIAMDQTLNMVAAIKSELLEIHLLIAQAGC